MERREMAAWGPLLGFGAIFAFLVARMTNGMAVVDASAGELFAAYLAVVALATLVAAPASLIARGQGDERDRAIAARAHQNERIAYLVAVNVLLWQVIWQGAASGGGQRGLELQSPPVLFLTLFAMLFLGEFVRLASIIALYRWQRARG